MFNSITNRKVSCWLVCVNFMVLFDVISDSISLCICFLFFLNLFSNSGSSSLRALVLPTLGDQFLVESAAAERSAMPVPCVCGGGSGCGLLLPPLPGWMRVVFVVWLLQITQFLRVPWPASDLCGGRCHICIITTLRTLFTPHILEADTVSVLSCSFIY